MVGSGRRRCTNLGDTPIADPREAGVVLGFWYARGFCGTSLWDVIVRISDRSTRRLRGRVMIIFGEIFSSEGKSEFSWPIKKWMCILIFWFKIEPNLTN